MSLVTVLWSMISAACLTLAAVHLPAWWLHREERAGLVFSVLAISTALVALCELWGLHARTPEAYAAALAAAHMPFTVVLISVPAFLYLYLQAGRPVLAVCGLALSVLAIFFSGDSLNIRKITSLRHVDFLGDQVAVPVGVPNPWMLLGLIGTLLLVAFVVDATITAWRRHGGHVEVVVGSTIAFFMVASVGQALIARGGWLQSPVTVSPFLTGVVGAAGYAMCRDLVNAKQLVAELRENELEAALAAAAANVGTFTRDIQRNTIWASPKWRELFGFSPTERLNIEQVLLKVHPDDRLTFDNGLVFEGGKSGEYHREFRLLLPGGRTRWILHHGRVELDAKGRPMRSRGASIDITARKHAEQEMLRLREYIAHVGRVSVMGQLASALAHEISQPLAAILRNAEAAALFMQEPSPDLAEISAIVDDIRKDDQRASAVIDRMRMLLRRQPVEMNTLDLEQVLGDVATLLRPDAAARHVKFEVEVTGRIPPVRGDRVQLQQVLLNLIINAMDALEGIREENRRVRVTVRQEAPEHVEIGVSDTGHGIPVNDLAHIFDPFFSSKPKGIGMGLAISRTLVEAHGGRIWAENNAGGVGACFRFTLPIAV